MDLAAIDWLPTALAFASNFVLGALWYGLLAEPWMRETGLEMQEIQSGDWPMPAYAVAAVGAALQAILLGALVVAIRPESIGQFLLLGAGIGVAAAFATGKHHAFSKKTWRLFAIDGGNDLAGFVVMSLVFAGFALLGG